MAGYQRYQDSQQVMYLCVCVCVCVSVCLSVCVRARVCVCAVWYNHPNNVATARVKVQHVKTPQYE